MAEGDPVAFSATFTSFRPVQSRGVTMLMFEVPAEQGQRAIELLGGHPSPSQQVCVAIVRLKQPPNEGRSMAEPNTDQSPEQMGRDAVIAAGIRPKEPPFQRWILKDQFDPDDPKANIHAAQDAIRKRCGIVSRTELSTDRTGRALALWRELIAEWIRDTGGRSGA